MEKKDISVEQTIKSISEKIESTSEKIRTLLPKVNDIIRDTETLLREKGLLVPVKIKVAERHHLFFGNHKDKSKCINGWGIYLVEESRCIDYADSYTHLCLAPAHKRIEFVGKIEALVDAIVEETKRIADKADSAIKLL